MNRILSQRKCDPNIELQQHEEPARRAPRPSGLSDVHRGWALGEMLEAHLTSLDSIVRGFGAARGPSSRPPGRNGY
jgi:hypothetical protein